MIYLDLKIDTINNGSEKIFMQVMNNQEFKAVVFEKLPSSIYESINSEQS